MGNCLVADASHSNNSKYDYLMQPDTLISTEQITSKLENLQNQLLVLGDAINNLRNKQDKDAFTLQIIQSTIQESKLKNVLLNEKIAELENNQKITKDNINAITKDMESLLENDKLLLDKPIEKNIVSTIQEEE